MPDWDALTEFFGDDEDDTEGFEVREPLAKRPRKLGVPVTSCPKCGKPRVKGWYMHEKHCKGLSHVNAD